MVILGVPTQFNTSPGPETRWDATLIRSPHIFLLGILFHIKTFKSLVVDFSRISTVWMLHTELQRTEATTWR
ncbi:hypothetical protein I7I48_06685 [Histoplasma ohiense]|nr:hypothetical protein I7I48_06685 [Histoplasma ohiense (nom. inval.)]